RRVGHEGAPEDAFERLRYLAKAGGEVLTVDATEQFEEITRLAGSAPGNHLVKHHAEGEDVARRRRRLAPSPLPRPMGWGARNAARPAGVPNSRLVGLNWWPVPPRHAEVDDLDGAGRRNKYVGGF